MKKFLKPRYMILLLVQSLILGGSFCMCYLKSSHSGGNHQACGCCGHS